MADAKKKSEKGFVDLDDVKEYFGDLSGKFNEQFNKLGSEVKKYSAKGSDAVVKSVEENPVKAVGVALLCGVVVGYLLGRK